MLKYLIKCIMARLPVLQRLNSDSYVIYLRNIGVRIGERSVVFDPRNVFIDPSRPYMIEIGDDVQITRGVTILTHDYSWSVLKRQYAEVLGSAGKVKIGNNVFIGMQSTILKGVTIGDNVIVGANSLVSHDVPPGCVVAGNPAKVIMSTEDFYKSRQKAQLDEARAQAVAYRQRYGKFPPAEEMNEFFWLFAPRGDKLNEKFEYQMNRVGNYEASRLSFLASKPAYEGYEAFLRAIEENDV